MAVIAGAAMTGWTGPHHPINVAVCWMVSEQNLEIGAVRIGPVVVLTLFFMNLSVLLLNNQLRCSGR